MGSLRRIASVVGTVTLLGLPAACGGSSGKGKADGPVAVGNEASLDRTTTTAAAAGTTAPTTRPTASTRPGAGVTAAPPGAQGTPTTAPSGCEGGARAANLVCRDDASGLRLELVVADRLTFNAADGMKLQLRAINKRGESVSYDSNRFDVFTIRPADGRKSPTWTESDCAGPPEGAPGPPIELSPGEDVRFVADYPPQTDSKGQPSKCHTLDAGEYDVVGRVRTCPPGSHDRGFCDTSKTVDALSAPLRIRISA